MINNFLFVKIPVFITPQLCSASLTKPTPVSTTSIVVIIAPLGTVKAINLTISAAAAVIQNQSSVIVGHWSSLTSSTWSLGQSHTKAGARLIVLNIGRLINMVISPNGPTMTFYKLITTSLWSLRWLGPLNEEAHLHLWSHNKIFMFLSSSASFCFIIFVVTSVTTSVDLFVNGHCLKDVWVKPGA